MKTVLLLFSFLAMSACEQAADAPADDPNDPDRFIAAVADGSSAGNSRADCVRDSKTGLYWERKSEDGLRSWHSTYSWFAPDEAHHELDYRGTANGGRCEGSDCDSYAFVTAVNEVALCGFNDWRLPSREELNSISDLRKAGTPPTVDTTAFPRTHAEEYWTAHDYSFEPSSAWTWSFRYGHDRVDWKKNAKYIRLVRGDAMQLAEIKE